MSTYDAGIVNLKNFIVRDGIYVMVLPVMEFIPIGYIPKLSKAIRRVAKAYEEGAPPKSILREMPTQIMIHTIYTLPAGAEVEIVLGSRAEVEIVLGSRAEESVRHVTHKSIDRRRRT